MRPFKTKHLWQTALWVGAAMLVWALLPAGGKAGTRGLFYNFQAPGWEAVSRLGGVQTYWSLRTRSKTELIEAGRDLARLNAAQRYIQQENTALKAELNALELALQLPELAQYQLSIARVVRRTHGAWWQEMVINKGTQHGVQPGQAVIYGGGAVGRVRSTRSNTAVVQLIGSRGFRVAAHFEGDRRPVTYQGTGSAGLRLPTGSVRDVPPDVNPSEAQPLRLSTSRLGGVFPSGLTIGWVSQLNVGPDGLFKTGPVKLDAALASVQEVAVLLPAAQ